MLNSGIWSTSKKKRKKKNTQRHFSQMKGLNNWSFVLIFRPWMNFWNVFKCLKIISDWTRKVWNIDTARTDDITSIYCRVDGCVSWFRSSSTFQYTDLCCTDVRLHLHTVFCFFASAWIHLHFFVIPFVPTLARGSVAAPQSSRWYYLKLRCVF